MKKTNSSEINSRLCALYDHGKTAIFASSSDPRLHMVLYVPPQVTYGHNVNLVVAVHGTTRTSAIEFRDEFAEFGLYKNCAILCPIFPMNVLGDGARSGYKYLEEGPIRYDLELISMVEEMGAKYNQDWSQFALFGYSGGGHFAHRFAIIHPERLWAVSIGAPGSVTLLDPRHDWWVGIRDVEQRFGKPVDVARLSKVAVQMLVGSLDLETWEITHAPGSERWMEGANDAGVTRPERLRSLARSFEAAGIRVAFEEVPGVSHDRCKMLEYVKSFSATFSKGGVWCSRC